MNTELLKVESDSQLDYLLDSSDKERSAAQYLSFVLGGELYCVDILSVREIRGWLQPTLLPNSPDYVKGVINIRGEIVPGIDLRERFNLHHDGYHQETVVIVLTSSNERVMGIVVDAVSDVFNILSHQIKDMPNVSSDIDSDNIIGLCNMNERVVVVLNVDKVIGMSEIKQHYFERQ